MHTLIREATSVDRDVAFDLASKLATSFEVQKEAFVNSFHKVLDNENAQLYFAEKDEEIIGYCLGFIHPAFYANGNVAWVEEIFVEENFRKQNIGKQLMQNFEAWAKENGCALVSLATRRASIFYQAIGYQDSAVYFKKNL